MIDGAPPSLTVVIPAYNEARRIQATLEDTLAYLREQPYAGNVILVDDGSTDDTVVVATAVAEGAPELMVLTIPHSGKAVAVQSRNAGRDGRPDCLYGCRPCYPTHPHCRSSLCSRG